MSNASGFSLVELSIVLIILGLLTGGILGGQSLIHAAELRSVSKEYEQWHLVSNTFLQRYNARPGDMPNATRFWGRADTGAFSGECAAPLTDTGDSPTTCNGDGDGKVWANNELHRFWQHLASAGLITGEYTGVHGPGSTNHAIIGENAPASKYSGAGWSTMFYGDYAGDAWMFAYNFGHVFFVGGQHGSFTTLNPLFPVEDAWNIDQKLDDGKPAKGKIVGYPHQTCTDAADQNDSDAEYDLSNTGQVCAILFPKSY